MAPTTSTGPKQYDETVVIALIMALKAKGGTLADPLKDMTALDGNRSQSGFEHSLRAVNRLATVLNEKKARGEGLGPGDVGGAGAGGAGGGVGASPRKRGGGAAGSASSTPKRVRGGKAKEEEKTVKDEEE
ncbi:hypothetical protein FKW77_010796 [Venturia effusa]|uniref:Uncharacterized protein n=1 Tax=Venturia effusa TaxID=50376 RepID=A0A517KYG7_9PEZI|nr:hypothetical protein FKW77_010796 [Venturia effusa]